MLLAGLGLGACTEIIDIELDSTYKRLVVYGTITTDSAHHQVQLTPPGPVVLAEPAVLVAVRIGLPVLLPEQEQGDILAREFVADVLPVGYTSSLCREIRWWREQQLLQMGLVKIRWQRPAQTGLSRAAQVFTHGGAADATGRRNLAVAQPSLPLEAKNFFDLTHG